MKDDKEDDTVRYKNTIDSHDNSQTNNNNNNNDISNEKNLRIKTREEERPKIKKKVKKPKKMSTVDGKILQIIEDENEPSEIIKDKKTGKNIMPKIKMDVKRDVNYIYLQKMQKKQKLIHI